MNIKDIISKMMDEYIEKTFLELYRMYTFSELLIIKQNSWREQKT